MIMTMAFFFPISSIFSVAAFFWASALKVKKVLPWPPRWYQVASEWKYLEIIYNSHNNNYFQIVSWSKRWWLFSNETQTINRREWNYFSSADKSLAVETFGWYTHYTTPTLCVEPFQLLGENADGPLATFTNSIFSVADPPPTPLPPLCPLPPLPAPLCPLSGPRHPLYRQINHTALFFVSLKVFVIEKIHHIKLTFWITGWVGALYIFWQNNFMIYLVKTDLEQFTRTFCDFGG